MNNKAGAQQLSPGFHSDLLSPQVVACSINAKAACAGSRRTAKRIVPFSPWGARITVRTFKGPVRLRRQ